MAVDPTILPGYRPPAAAPAPGPGAGGARSKFKQALLGDNPLDIVSPGGAKRAFDRLLASAGPGGPKRLGSIGDLKNIAAAKAKTAPAGQRSTWWDKFGSDHKLSADKSYADYKKLMGD